MRGFERSQVLSFQSQEVSDIRVRIRMSGSASLSGKLERPPLPRWARPQLMSWRGRRGLSRVDLDHVRVLSTDPRTEVRDNLVDEGSDQGRENQESCQRERVFQSHPHASALGQVHCRRHSDKNDRNEKGNTMPPAQPSEADGSRVCLFVHIPRHTAAGSMSQINRGVLPSTSAIVAESSAGGVEIENTFRFHYRRRSVTRKSHTSAAYSARSNRSSGSVCGTGGRANGCCSLGNRMPSQLSVAAR